MPWQDQLQWYPISYIFVSSVLKDFQFCHIHHRKSIAVLHYFYHLKGFSQIQPEFSLIHAHCSSLIHRDYSSLLCSSLQLTSLLQSHFFFMVYLWITACKIKLHRLRLLLWCQTVAFSDGYVTTKTNWILDFHSNVSLIRRFCTNQQQHKPNSHPSHLVSYCWG